jgi:nucleotide-binding universal stress UspA family protein
VPIVVACVSTPEGRSALRAAGEEAVLRSSTLVMVWPERSSRSLDDEANAQLEATRSAVQAELDAHEVAYELRTVDGSNDPAMDLISTAEDVGAELIVIGLRRRTPVGKLVLGANAQRILLDAPCAVLAVKAEQS